MVRGRCGVASTGARRVTFRLGDGGGWFGGLGGLPALLVRELLRQRDQRQQVGHGHYERRPGRLVVVHWPPPSCLNASMARSVSSVGKSEIRLFGLMGLGSFPAAAQRLMVRGSTPQNRANYEVRSWVRPPCAVFVKEVNLRRCRWHPPAGYFLQEAFLPD